MSEVTLESLVGEHLLTGVDTGKIPNTDDWGGSDECETLTFVLDGEVYTATEDPSDGYRSCMGSLVNGGVVVSNTFAPQKVICSYRDRYSDNEKSEVLEMRDASTGEIVLTVGTENTDDYYPYFVANFDPRGLACNQGL